MMATKSMTIEKLEIMKRQKEGGKPGNEETAIATAITDSRLSSEHKAYVAGLDDSCHSPRKIWSSDHANYGNSVEFYQVLSRTQDFPYGCHTSQPAADDSFP